MLRNLTNGDVFEVNESLCLGRNPLTRIKDLKCSRKQVKILYKAGDRFATLSHIGRHRCAVNGRVMCRGCETRLYDGDTFQLLPQKYEYRFEAEVSAGTRTETVIDGVKEGECCERKGVQRLDGSRTPAQWTTQDDVLMSLCPPPANYVGLVSGFDLDGTLIRTKSGRKFPKDCSDWQVAFPEVPGRVKSLYKDGYRVVVFSNQKGLNLKSGVTQVDDFQQKLDAIRSVLGVPMCFFVATGDSFNRKPRPGMWLMMERMRGDDRTVDRTGSFFVGDAAGRVSDASSRLSKDHSCADRLFALNLGVKFFTPESFFANKADRSFNLPAFDPKTLPPQNGGDHDPIPYPMLPTDIRVDLDVQQVVVMVGFPASGKSHFVRTYLVPLGFACVSQDQLKSSQKCVQMTEGYLQNNKSVVVDNTNPTTDSRRPYVSAAQRYGVPCRCFLMNVTYDQARHNDAFRRIVGTDRAHSFNSAVVLNSYRAKFMPPSLSEGFAAIVRVNFVPRFVDKQSEQLYRMFLVDS